MNLLEAIRHKYRTDPEYQVLSDRLVARCQEASNNICRTSTKEKRIIRKLWRFMVKHKGWPRPAARTFATELVQNREVVFGGKHYLMTPDLWRELQKL